MLGVGFAIFFFSYNVLSFAHISVSKLHCSVTLVLSLVARVRLYLLHIFNLLSHYCVVENMNMLSQSLCIYYLKTLRFSETNASELLIPVSDGRVWIMDK